MAKKNILIIVTDQLTWRALPVYGDKYANTPAIDSISGNAAVFERGYTPCPLCLPARASFWSGIYPHETGAISNGLMWPVTPVSKDLPTLGAVFREAGYDAVHFGKTHDAGTLRGFTCAEEDQLPVEQESDAFPLNFDTFRDRYTAKVAVEYLEKEKEQPFLMVADFVNPHNICGLVGAFAGPHENPPEDALKDMPELPENFDFGDIENRPKAVQYICCSHNRQAQTAGWTQDNYRHYLAAYYHYVNLVDREIGKVLDALRSRPDADDTLIVFFSDHGDSMAARGRVTKQVDLYEEVTRVPFFFSGPGIKPSRIDAPVSLLDLFPTLCGWARLPAPDGLRGVDLSGALLGGAVPERPYVVSQWHTEWGYTVSPGRMITNGRYKYIAYAEENSEELYDLKQDPLEMTNRAGDPAFSRALSHMRRLFEDYLKETDDPFRELEWKADTRWRSHDLGYHRHEGNAAPQEAWETVGRPSF
jgi:choline-sulfatase